MYDMNRLKKEYEEIVCSDELKERIAKTMKKRNNSLIRTITATAAALIIVTTTLNTVPSVSVAAQDIPIIKNIVNVLTAGRFSYNRNGVEGYVETPEITGLSDKELEKRLNREFKENAGLIKSLISDVANNSEKTHEAYGMNYEVKTNNDKYLSLDVYTFFVGGSSNISHSYYVIDKSTSTILTLDDVYKNTPDYRRILAEYIEKDMRRQNEEENATFFLPDDGIEADDIKEALYGANKFYINSDNEIVICFEKYEIAAGSQGVPEFVIPSTLIESTI